MRSVSVNVDNTPAGVLTENKADGTYRFEYLEKYNGPPVSLTMPVRDREFLFQEFPPFFEGLLPEGIQLEGLLRIQKIDKNDLMAQLIAVGKDMVGAVTVVKDSE